MQHSGKKDSGTRAGLGLVDGGRPRADPAGGDGLRCSRRFHRARARGPVRQAQSSPATWKPLARAFRRAAASRRIAGRQAANADYIAELFTSSGFDTRIERLTLFPTRRARASSSSRRRRATRHDWPSRRSLRTRRRIRPHRAAADLQRLLDERRRDRRRSFYVNYGVPADYEELDAARRRREGQDRHRALRRLVARHQAEGRRRARRGRLPHLLRPARRRLLPGRRVPEGRVPQASAAPSAAR